MSRFGSLILIMAFLVVVPTPCWCQTTQSQQEVDLQSWSTDDEADSSLQLSAMSGSVAIFRPNVYSLDVGPSMTVLSLSQGYMSFPSVQLPQLAQLLPLSMGSGGMEISLSVPEQGLHYQPGKQPFSGNVYTPAWERTVGKYYIKAFIDKAHPVYCFDKVVPHWELIIKRTDAGKDVIIDLHLGSWKSGNTKWLGAYNSGIGRFCLKIPLNYDAVKSSIFKACMAAGMVYGTAAIVSDLTAPAAFVALAL